MCSAGRETETVAAVASCRPLLDGRTNTRATRQTTHSPAGPGEWSWMAAVLFLPSRALVMCSDSEEPVQVSRVVHHVSHVEEDEPFELCAILTPSPTGSCLGRRVKPLQSYCTRSSHTSSPERRVLRYGWWFPYRWSCWERWLVLDAICGQYWVSVHMDMTAKKATVFESAPSPPGSKRQRLAFATWRHTSRH
ncbi:hypothetical protein CONLIGDRAFT_107731 [Coniochaeta ligniaria NRRL 30616]|uniref:Uncharacterized protein n=1 Tax=Coniochaeta ligniaria NRRL 30616 TaxID=1408157 RepID=A0A1J7J317_9PEZI|nr:hypothetical protein CONLIGDRAFT_107731 [Coniochaeta ligniaria NRRL 30616]